MRNTKTNFSNAEQAFEYFYDLINDEGVEFDGTKALFNVGFYLENPLQTTIKTPYRKWSPKYAQREWNWYMSGNPNAEEISKHAPIWKKMMDENGNVRSNYGWQWRRNNQIYKVIAMLTDKQDTRKAVISIYDGKEIDTYEHDTPCTYAVQFTILNDKLNMSVLMRSNDLWYGFCNDQYCFAKLQEYVAGILDVEVGWYYHYAHNLHVYKEQQK
jgi:thymidylate synthase